jgi:nicotinamide phosphoribosyltransferase
MNYNSLILNTDSYKASHFLQTPPGTQTQFSYIESRGGRYDSTIFFGLQSAIKQYLTTPITQQDIEEASEFFSEHGEPFNRQGWEYILNNCGGLLPIIIKAVPEGTSVPTHNALVTVESTDSNCAWVVSYVETLLLRAVWYGTTVATQSWYIKQQIAAALGETGDIAGLPFKLHDFGSRGVSSFESAGLGGSAHLVNFMGSDTITGVLFVRKYYGEQMAGFSIPAAEHSTITPFGPSGEATAYRNMIKQFSKPGSIYAVVSDSYDIYNACENIWGDELKAEVISSGGMLVIRPDSGDPAPVVLNIARILEKQFGVTINSKGYKVLNNVHIIQGDGINQISIAEILQALKNDKFSADNIAFGMGGALLQQLDRDTQKFAMKCSAIKINGIWHDVYKDPVTDSGKRSKKGRITLVEREGVKQTIRIEELLPSDTELLRSVFHNGKLVVDMKFSEVRENSNK